LGLFVNVVDNCCLSNMVYVLGCVFNVVVNFIFSKVLC
jgi:hypothetical protein